MPFQTCSQSGQKDGAKTAQNIVYKTSTAAKVRACAEVEHLAMEIVFSYRFFQKSLAFQAGQINELQNLAKKMEPKLPKTL